MSDKLYVGNLSFNSTETDVTDAFSAYGVVVEVSLITDRETGQMRGFGFVTMGTPEEALAAIEGLNGKQLGDRDLTVNLAKPREDRGGGGGGGYRGGGGGNRGGGSRGGGGRY